MTTFRLSEEEREVMQHLARPDLPWRPATRTRCGRNIGELADGRVIDVETARKKVARLGQQRAALFLCMTCCNHVGDWPEWDTDPAGLLGRHCAPVWQSRKGDEAARLLDADLRALAVLAELHRDDFDALVAARLDGDVVTIGDLRKQRSSKLAANRYGRTGR